MTSDRTPRDLKAALTERARELGFDDCRIARAEAPEHATELREWLDRGAAGEMAWIERGATKRAEPELVLAGVKSVVVLALNYWQGGTQSPRPNRSPTPEEVNGLATPDSVHGGGGRIARYAWGDDYHDVIEAKLKQLNSFLEAAGGRQRYYVDTGPVLERDFAAAAGIGWHGKSTMLLNRKLGTWFFLAEIFTTLELPPDPPQPARCGTCTSCIDACPTGAITSPHRLDARRCISYLTIELKGSIPLELRPLLGDRIYGCDDCLDACPWNRFAKVSREAAFAARPAVKQLSLGDFLALDDDGFRALFRGSPIKRIKRCGFLRNVCVALGNVGTEADRPALERAARDSEPLIAEHAAWALAQLDARRTAPAA